MKATILPYLKAVGFDVKFANANIVNIHDDCALVKHARRYKRILVCHDRHRDKRRDRGIRLRISQEIFNNGGCVIQVSGGSDQPILTSLGVSAPAL